MQGRRHALVCCLQTLMMMMTRGRDRGGRDDDRSESSHRHERGTIARANTTPRGGEGGGACGVRVEFFDGGSSHCGALSTFLFFFPSSRYLILSRIGDTWWSFSSSRFRPFFTSRQEIFLFGDDDESVSSTREGNEEEECFHVMFAFRKKKKIKLLFGFNFSFSDRLFFFVCGFPHCPFSNVLHSQRRAAPPPPRARRHVVVGAARILSQCVSEAVLDERASTCHEEKWRRKPPFSTGALPPARRRGTKPPPYHPLLLVVGGWPPSRSPCVSRCAPS